MAWEPQRHLFPFFHLEMVSNISNACAPFADAYRSAGVRGKKNVWLRIEASESELCNWPTQHERRKGSKLPDESLKSESEPCWAPSTYVSMWQWVLHHRLLLKLSRVHELQAVGLVTFLLRGKQKGDTCTLRMLSTFCSGSKVRFGAVQSCVCFHLS